MATPLIDSAPAPSWVDSGPGQGRGYDLLGLRLPAQAISYDLLDGVTTITPTVRYLAIRAWIAHSYAQAGRPSDGETFREFAAGVEAAVAYGNLLNDFNRGGVLGKTKAKRVISSGDGTLPLLPLVGQIGVQVYGGPSSQLLLQDSEESVIPRLTRERGVPLAEGLAGRVSGCELGRIFNAGVCPGAASREPLTEFGRLVDVADIPEPEAALICAAILPERPLPVELPRVATNAMLLSVAGALGRTPTVDDIFRVVADPDTSLQPTLRPTLDGWLYYLVRDTLAYCHEAVLDQVIRELESRGGDRKQVTSEEVVAALVAAADEHALALKKLGLLAGGESPQALTFSEVGERVRATTVDRVEAGDRGPARWRGGLTELAVISAVRAAGAGALALLPVSWLLALERAAYDPSAVEETSDPLSRQGWARVGLRQVIDPAVRAFHSADRAYRDVMFELARRTVDQHLRVAWARWSQDPKRDVALLLADGGLWSSRRRKFRAGRTNSRLGVSLSWLRQLRLIDERGLTPTGSAALGRALAVLEAVGHE
jgi:DNA-binding transcriptional ArsR family regulator